MAEGADADALPGAEALDAAQQLDEVGGGGVDVGGHHRGPAHHRVGLGGHGAQVTRRRAGRSVTAGVVVGRRWPRTAKRGLSLDFGTSWFLRQRIGVHKAKELAFTARSLDATEAHELGLVTTCSSATSSPSAAAGSPGG